MVATSAKWSDEKLKKASNHLRYEIEMFYKQGKLLLSGEFGGATKNALNEAFYVHARALLRFFDRGSGSRHEVVARNYLPGRRLGMLKALKIPDHKELQSRINDVILHLSYKRIPLCRLPKKWSAKPLMEAMLPPLVEFYQEVKRTAPNTLHERLVKVMKKYCRCT